MTAPSLGSARAGEQRGVTLVELLLAVVIAAIVLLGMANVVKVVFGTSSRTVDNLGASNSAIQLSARFEEDVVGSLPYGQVEGARRGQHGCGRQASVLRLVGGEAGDQRVVSYHLVEVSGAPALQRRTCRGEDVDTALTAPFSHQASPVTDLAAGDDAVVVVCRAAAGADPSPDDAQCRRIELTIKTGGYQFTVDGTRRRPLDKPVDRAPAANRCTLEPVADATVDMKAPDQNYGSSNIQGEQTLDVFKGAYIDSTAAWPGTTPINSGTLSARDQHRTAWLHSLLRFDLTEPCIGRGEPPFLPAGKARIKGELSLYFVRPPTSTGASSTPTDPELATIRLYDLAAGAIWDEGRVTWCTAPLGVNSYGTAAGPVGDGGSGVKWTARDDSGHKNGCGARSTDFGWDTTTTHDLTFPISRTDQGGNSYRRLDPLDVTSSVQGWYAGTAVNNGWRLQWLPPEGVSEPSRLGGVRQPRIHDINTGASFRFGSREAAASRRPRLTITWCNAGGATCDL